ncbi:MFS transporter [Piscinibacter gummiphilus]|uniref:MFS transporter n=1 Tax=Piscinibacter gummiphilus TaxID=946333 RepID=A0A1W6LAE1_9BURK|nr:MFS transporter [Piscinibacter gummiphilus]ARN21203.1 MFS transporter [Piscinibacter gummiphilus]ATU65886.1 MFS transporter [Piscinibacter gummiphilus]GLS93765.1 MFS transporter [Piscinibacter gummiphilus]
MTAPTAAVPLRQDARTIGLIGLAHGSSHFFHLMLPPLFPLFIRDFGLSYAELGLLVSTFFVISGVGQALSGFLVDRIGARPILFAALGCFALGAVATATANGYAGLFVGASLAGLGNAPFHPVDFTILNKRVSQPRLGHAFSVHGISGNLGWAVAPVFLLGLTNLTGSWRIASASMAAYALIVIAILWFNRDAIDDKAGAWAHETAKGPAARAVVAEHPLAFLRLPSVWLCFSFFFFSTAALSAIQSFASPALEGMYGLPLTATAFVVTGYMLFGAAGMVVGGFLAAGAERLEKIIGACLLASAVLLAVVGTGWLPGMVAAALAAIAGFGTGLAGPSRDMLIKQAAPPGATGRVYGTVYSGLDLGFALAAPIFGSLLDHGQSNGVFYGSALALALGVLSASMVGAGVARSRGVLKAA